MPIQLSGLRIVLGTASAAAIVAGVLLLASGSSVSAPEPARLNGPLYGNGSAASATYVTTKLPTSAHQWPGSWAVGSIPSGTPCATYYAPPGTILVSSIQASGNYRKCM